MVRIMPSRLEDDSEVWFQHNLQSNIPTCPVNVSQEIQAHACEFEYNFGKYPELTSSSNHGSVESGFQNQDEQVSCTSGSFSTG